MSDLHRKALIKRVARECGVSRAVVARVLQGTVAVLADALARDEAVIWTGLGVFAWSARAARVGVTPRTGARLTIPAHRTPICKVGDAFKRRLTGAACGANDEGAP